MEKIRIIRRCNNTDCNAIYTELGDDLLCIKACPKCGNATSFFRDKNHFFKYIDINGIDTDDIIDPQLLENVKIHYKIT